MRHIIAPLIAVAIWGSIALPAQEKKKSKKEDPPRVIMAVPLGAAPGNTVKFTIRGLKLSAAKTIRFANSQVKAKILSMGAAPVPDKNPQKVGDTQVVVEVTLPKDLSDGPLPFTIVTPAGETKPHHLLIEAKVPVIKEKEPNDGFAESQTITVPQVIDGQIDRPRDVDVYRLKGKAGQKLTIEVLAARYGSELDSILTLYDASGQEIAANDDSKDSVDSRLAVTLPADGECFITLMDAHDQGGPAHVYRLVVK